MTLGRAALAMAFALVLLPSLPASAAAGSCGDLPDSVSCGTSADAPDGYFHGVIGVSGQGWVLDLSSHSGNSPGCGDCTWSLILACPDSSPQDPGGTQGCAGLNGGFGCPPDEVPFRLYLSTSTMSDELVGTICLGGSVQIVSVGEDGDADVQRYLHDVSPPDLLIHRRPRGATLSGLTTYFAATVPPGALAPVEFGGPTVSESITLVPEAVRWEWGDGEQSGWLPVAATASHRYMSGGVKDAVLTTRWAATYTVTFDGRTVGPFDATGTVDHSQRFVERVDTSDPALVSG
jgi:hypothetical protein